MGHTQAVPISFKGGCLAYLDYVTDGLKRRLNMKVGDKKFSTFLGMEVEHRFRTFGAGIGANDTAKFRFPDDEFPDTNLLIRRSHDSGLLIFIGPTYVNRRLGKCLMIPVDTYFEILNEKDMILASGRVIRIEGLIRSHETFISNGGHSPSIDEHGTVVCRLSHGTLEIYKDENRFVSLFSGGYKKEGTSLSDSIFLLGLHLRSIGEQRKSNNVMQVHDSSMLDEISFLLRQEEKRIERNRVKRQKRIFAEMEKKQP